MQELPTGTVTFLFTDIEGSTQILQRLGDRYPAVLEDHALLIRGAVGRAGGIEVSTEGDAFFCVFPGAPQAVEAAAAIQRALAAHTWPDGAEVRVRIGLHTGEGVLGGDNYVGLDVHRAARIASAGHGGQVVLSGPTHALAQQALTDDVALRDLGAHRLKDLEHPEHLHELLIDGLPQDFPPLRTLDPRLHNLPVQLTSFLGREAEVAEVRDALARARLVTLTGPGGTGKTRLAIEAATAESGVLADGAWFVDLTPITDPSLLATAVVEALGIRYAAGDARDQLAQHFESRDALLALDNFEQLLPAAPTVADLLRECPKLRILVTSRAPLRITGEQEVPIPPLPAPSPHLDTRATTAVTEFPAVQLFVERAAAARPDFALTDDNTATVAEITARLDGLPLAIELAAALVKLLPPQSILDRLERSLDVLTGGPQDLPERQRSLRGAIAWSYELLDERARLLLEHLAVFAGGASFDLVEQVCAPEDLGMVLDALRTLVDQSLVVQSEEAGEPRFSMLGAIRDFALERLEERGVGDTVRRRHAEAFRALAEEVDRGIRGPDEARWAALAARELDNLRAAVTWGMETRDTELVLSTVYSLFRYAMFRDLDEVSRWAESALDLPGAEQHALFAPTCGAAAWGTMSRGELDRARELAERGLAAVPDPDDRRRLDAIEVLADSAMFEGRVEDALRYEREAARLAEDPWDRVHELVFQSLLATYGGDANEGLAVATRFVREAKALGNPTLVAWSFYTQGEALMQQDPQRAMTPFEEAIASAGSVGSHFIVGVAQVSLTSLQARHGDARAALVSFRELVDLWRRAGNWTQLWVMLRSVAEAFARLGSLDAAAVLHAGIMEAEMSAPVYGEDAYRLAGLSDRIEAELDPEVVQRGRARGRSLSDEEVVDFVRDEIDHLLTGE